jgi:branched-chain amino acid transport system ATP-binding protein
MHTSDMLPTVLDVSELVAGYGKHMILRGVTFQVAAGEIVALLGANGVGKTTLLNAISGFIRPASGSIKLAGNEIAGLPPHRTFRHGIVQVSQSRDLFPDLCVEDNLRLGAASRSGKLAVETQLGAVYTSFPRLEERKRQNTRTLSGGEQQMVAIGRAVMSTPRIFLLDEPSGGLAPQFVNEIGNIVGELKASGATMLIVEQNISLASRVADRCIVLRDGQITGEVATVALQSGHDELVRSIYL